MSKVSPNRRIERAGVNALRALLEEHNHLVQEIDGGADHGEDLFVMLVEHGRRTGHYVAIQVKSGKSYKRRRGYAIPVGDHRTDWLQSRIPVIGVVFDPAIRRLFWVNLSDKLVEEGNGRSWIDVSRESELRAETISSFVADLKRYIDKAEMRLYLDSKDVGSSVRAARIGIPLDSSKSSDGSNPIFSGIADFLLLHPLLRRRVWHSLVLLLVGSIMLLEWPLQYRFAERYMDFMPPWIWVGLLYYLALFVLVMIKAEWLANRFPIGLIRFLAWLCAFYLVLPFMMGDGQGFDMIWGRSWGALALILSHVVPISVGAYYVMVEMDRRRQRL